MSIRRMLFILFLIVICLFSVRISRQYFERIDDSHPPDGQMVHVTGRVYYKDMKNGRAVYYLKDASIYSSDYSISNISFILYYSKDDIPNTACINADGILSTFDQARNDGNFDAKKYYESLGLAFSVEAENVEVGHVDWLFKNDYFYKLRKRVASVYERYLFGEETGIMSAMALGDKSQLLSQAKELYQMAGIANVLAISGLHISFVGMGIYGILRKLGLKYQTCVGISATLISLYALITGNGVSTRRAVGMFFIYLVAQLLGEGYDMFSAACLLAILILACEPYFVNNSGFQFSFGAVFSICLVVQPLQKRFNDCWEEHVGRLVAIKGLEIKYEPTLKMRLVKGFLSSFIFSFFITISTLPLVALNYYEIPTYSLFLNMLILPLMAPLLGMGLIGGMAGAVADSFAALSLSGSSAFIFAGFLTNNYVLSLVCGYTSKLLYLLVRGLLFACHLIIYLVELLSDNVLKLPFSRIITGCPAVWQVVVYYVLLVAFANVDTKKISRMMINVRNIKEKNEEKILKAAVRTKESLMAVHSDIYMNFLFQMIACFSLVIIIFIPQKKFFHIDFLDVGQGDGIYVEAEDGTAIFIDGGSTSVNEVGRYRILPYLKYHGIRKINYWYVSHTDEDHISGLREALEAEYPISNIIFSYKVEQNENWQGIVNLAEEKGVPVSYIKAGDRLVCGNVNSKGVNGESSKKNSSACMTLTAVFPDENSSFEGANENSLVLLLNYDNFDAMLTGDIGAEQEQYIAENDLLGINDKNTTLDGKIEVLKIAHHGSKNSSDSEFLTYISADTAIISCAKKNNYGHPAREAVERIEEVGYIIRYTMEEGQIRVN